LLTEDEKAKAEKDAAFEAMKERVETLEREKTEATFTAKLTSIGYDGKLAMATAKALAEGKMDEVFANMKQHGETKEQALRAEILKSTPTPQAAGSASTANHASTADNATNATNATIATNAGHADNADDALRAVVATDATNAVEVYNRIMEVTDGKLADIVINCVNIENTEMASILACKVEGLVYFFSMATSFTKAALGAEGVGKEVDMIVGNGYTKGHAEITLQCLREHEGLRNLFAEMYA
jgi:hypothetical protein